MKFVNGLPDEMSDNLKMLDDLGGPTTYNHYPNGWAMAFNTPFKMWKRYEFNGGTSDPCVISWPAGMKARGEIRTQYHHAIDLVPTILDVLQVEAPEAIKGHTQAPFDGVSMRNSFDDASAESGRKTQFYAMLGSRSIWHEGWKAVTTHPCIAGWGNFNDDEWELYHVDVDRAEVHNLAAEQPDKLREMINIWFSEAGRNGAFPLDDRTPVEILMEPRPQLSAPRNRYSYFPGNSPVPEWQAVNTKNRSFVIGAVVSIPKPGAEGVLFAHGNRFGGHGLYIKDNRLHYVNNFVGSEEQMIVGSEDVPTGEDLILSASFEKQGQEPICATGTLSLYHGDKKVGEAPIKTQLGAFAVAGAPLFVGRHAGEPLTDDYPGEAPYAFTGGTIRQVAVDVSGDPYVDMERQAEMLLRSQ
jgi:arylsulfatase